MGATAHGLTELMEDLRKAADEAVTETRKVVSKGALNIKRDARARAAAIIGMYGGRTIPHYPSSITYNTKVEGTVVSAEIGPDKDRSQGPLGNLLEYGSIHNPPYPHLNPALDTEEPGFVDALEEVAAKLLEGLDNAVDAPESG